MSEDTKDTQNNTSGDTQNIRSPHPRERRKLPLRSGGLSKPVKPEIVGVNQTEGPTGFVSNVPGTICIAVQATNGANGIEVDCTDAPNCLLVGTNDGTAIYGGSSGEIEPASSYGVQGFCPNGTGVDGFSNTGTGVYGSTHSGTGIYAIAYDSGIGLHAVAGGVHPDGGPSPLAPEAAIYAEGGPGFGVYATSDTLSGIALLGISNGGYGVAAGNDNGTSVYTFSTTGTGIFSQSISGPAGVFSGDVQVNGALSKSGGGFQIDHPEDPAHKFLSHSFVESPDMKNIYDGVVVLDAQGEAEVTLPSWFDTLNTEFRYQLTAIGVSGPDLHIAEEILTNRFKIAGGKPHMKVCWQVTGIRHDAWAEAHRIPIEQDKPTQEQGYYLHPELYGETNQRSILRTRHPEPNIPVPPKK